MHKFFSAIIITVIALVLLFLFLIPQYQQAAALQQSLLQKQQEYYSDSAYNTKLSQTIQKINDQKDNLAKIDDALPSDFALAPMVYFFQKNASDNGLALMSTSLNQISPASENSQVKIVTFSLSLSGTYEHFKKFLGSMDNSARLFDVNSITFASSAPLGGSPNTKAQSSQAQTYEFNIVVAVHTY